MTKLKEKALRELGDQGADTLERYFAQIQYTAYWCVRMVRRSEGIEAIIPEGGEDIVLLRRGVDELHQIKTRDESQGPWRLAEVLPILCQQYHRRHHFSPNCHFHFVSDQKADVKTQKPGALYQLKHLLEIKHDNQPYSSDEQKEFEQFEINCIPIIQETMLNKFGEALDSNVVKALLSNTWIETDCPMVRTPDNLSELYASLDEVYPGIPPYTFPQLQSVLERLIMLIVKKIIKTTTLRERHIYQQDVLNCRNVVAQMLENDFPDLSQVPGNTFLDKKALLGGFNSTEIPRFHKHKLLAENLVRRYETIGMGDKLERLISALLEYQGECRDLICRVDGDDENIGPKILRMLKARLEPLRAAYFSRSEEIDDMICIGLLWRETEKCYAWWSPLGNSA